MLGGMVQEKVRKSRAPQQLDCIPRTVHQCAVFWVPLSHGNAEALDRSGGKTKRRMISFFLSNTSAKKLSQSNRVY